MVIPIILGWDKQENKITKKQKYINGILIFFSFLSFIANYTRLQLSRFK